MIYRDYVVTLFSIHPLLLSPRVMIVSPDTSTWWIIVGLLFHDKSSASHIISKVHVESLHWRHVMSALSWSKRSGSMMYFRGLYHVWEDELNLC